MRNKAKTGEKIHRQDLSPEVLQTLREPFPPAEPTLSSMEMGPRSSGAARPPRHRSTAALIQDHAKAFHGFAPEDV